MYVASYKGFTDKPFPDGKHKEELHKIIKAALLKINVDQNAVCYPIEDGKHKCFSI